MYPHPHSLNPLNVAEGGAPSVSAWGQAFDRAVVDGDIHRTFAIALYKPHAGLMWPARDGMQLNPITPKTTLPRVTYGYAGPVLLGPADSALYSK